MTPPMNHNKTAPKMPIALATFLPLPSISCLPSRPHLVIEMTALEGSVEALDSNT